MLDQTGYKLMMTDIEYFLSCREENSKLLDRLIVYKYRTLIKKAHKLLNGVDDPLKQAEIINFFFPESLIGFQLVLDLGRSDKKETRRITNLIKRESEILKLKIREVKDDDMYFEDEYALRCRLSAYMDEDDLEAYIRTCSLTDEDILREEEAYQKIKKKKNIPNDTKGVIIDFHTWERIK